jgi:hypothetical protein
MFHKKELASIKHVYNNLYKYEGPVQRELYSARSYGTKGFFKLLTALTTRPVQRELYWTQRRTPPLQRKN